MDLAGHYWSGHYWSIAQYDGTAIFAAVVVAVSVGYPLAAYAFRSLGRGLMFFAAVGLVGAVVAVTGAGLVGAIIPIFVSAAAALCGMRVQK